MIRLGSLLISPDAQKSIVEGNGLLRSRAHTESSEGQENHKYAVHGCLRLQHLTNNRCGG